MSAIGFNNNNQVLATKTSATSVKPQNEPEKSNLGPANLKKDSVGLNESLKTSANSVPASKVDLSEKPKIGIKSGFQKAVEVTGGAILGGAIGTGVGAGAAFGSLLTISNFSSPAGATTAAISLATGFGVGVYSGATRNDTGLKVGAGVAGGLFAGNAVALSLNAFGTGGKVQAGVITAAAILGAVYAYTKKDDQNFW